MAANPRAANYGRGDAGQFSPYRDIPKRRFYEEDEQQEPAPEPAPSPLARAVAPKSFTVQGSADGSSAVTSGNPGGTENSRVGRNAGSYRYTAPPLQSGSLSDVASGDSPARRSGGVVGRQSPPSYTSDGSMGRLYGASSNDPGAAESAMGFSPDRKQRASAQSPLATAVAPQGGLDKPVGVGQYQLEGYNYDRFADPNGRGNNTWKYRIGSVMSNYDPNDPAQVNAMVADLQSKGVDVSFDGKDKLTFGPGVVDDTGAPIGTIDVIRGAGAAGAGWAWQPQGGMGASDPLASAIGGQAADPVAQLLAQQMGIDTSNPLWKQILDQLISEQSGAPTYDPNQPGVARPY